MGKNPSTDTKSSQQFSSQYAWNTPPINAQTQSVIDAANAPVEADPATIGRYGAMEETVRHQTNDPFGAATSPDVRAKSQLSRILSIQRDRDQAMRADRHDAQASSFARKTAAAALTTPQLTQTGGTSSGTQNTTQNPGWLNTTVAIGSAAAT